MKAVILAAGKSTRTHPLTWKTPKALLPVANAPVIARTLSQLQGLVEEAVVVTGHGDVQLKEFLGDRFGRVKISYAEQKSQKGTADALLAAEKSVSGRFLLLMGDDLYGREDVKRCLKRDRCILVRGVSDVSRFGAVSVRDHRMSGIREKPRGRKPGHASTGMYVLDEKIFGFCRKSGRSSRGERELTPALVSFARKRKMEVEHASFWIPITYPWSLLEANEKILDGMAGDVYATVEKGVTIKGRVVVGRNTLLRSGTYVEGPAAIGKNCDIGPNCFIRPYTAIGDNCRIGNAVEVKNSIVMDGAKIGHLSYFGDSIAGKNANLGAGFMVANLRHDRAEIRSMVRGRLEGTGRQKFGTVIGDGAMTGINTLVCPGRKIWPGKTTLPGEVVKKDVRLDWPLRSRSCFSPPRPTPTSKQERTWKRAATYWTSATLPHSQALTTERPSRFQFLTQAAGKP